MSIGAYRRGGYGMLDPDKRRKKGELCSNYLCNRQRMLLQESLWSILRANIRTVVC
jgi:hypothetical protein